uniref:Uncharacterized protein n=1 Tax=Stomoxys calcitrans TaxID=35570 RepID=A0A1I8NVN7_STOCA
MEKNLESLLKTISDIEKSKTPVTKSVLVDVAKGFASVEKHLKRQEPGSHEIAIKWCNIYVDMQSNIDPKNFNLLHKYEKLAPIAVSFIIGFLQYKCPDDNLQHHYDILKILEILLDNLPTNSLKKFNVFKAGTLSSLWKPIMFGVDYKTQLLTLKLFSILMKYIDESKWTYELDFIEKEYFPEIKEKFKSVLKETSSQSAFEMAARDLLNNYNNLHSGKVLSFNCKYITIAKKFECFKRLNRENFWIDLNYTTKTISFEGRFKENLNTKYSNVECKFRVTGITFKSGVLQIDFDEHFMDVFDLWTKSPLLHIFLQKEEEERIQKDEALLQFINQLNEKQFSNDKNGEFDVLSCTDNDSENVFDELKNNTLQDNNRNENKNSSLLKSNRRSYISLINSPSPSVVDETSSNVSSICTNSIELGNTKNNSLSITSSPVSRKIKKVFEKKHPIRQLLSKRKNHTRSEEDEEYIPNKRAKRNTKKIKNKNENSSILNNNLTRPMDPSSVTNVTTKLRQGYECTIPHGNENTKETTKRNATEKIIKDNTVTAQRQLKARSLSLSPYVFVEDLPQIRSYRTAQNSIIDITSPQIMPSTSGSTSAMDISEIQEDSPNISVFVPNENSPNNWRNGSEINIQAFNESKVNDSIGCSMEYEGATAQAPTPLEISEPNEASTSRNLKGKQRKDYSKWKALSAISGTTSNVNKIKPIKAVCPRVEKSSINDHINNTEGENNSLNLRNNNVAENPITSYEINFSKQLKEYKSKIDIRLKHLRHSLNSGKENDNKQKASKITESIVHESRAQRSQIQDLINKVEYLKDQMDEQCQVYMERCMQIECFQKKAEDLLISLSKNSSINLDLTKKCDKLLMQFNGI